ncbi:MAG: glucose-6-phosphate dehydrogenase [candidate division NC10 bacterium]|nr:glucose-6-phosphate dehydrogenase [candidate division NC10 bacterium]
MNAEAKTTSLQVEAAVAETRCPDLGIPARECLTGNHLQPCAIVILGASGDLTARKLIPALFDLFRKGGLPDAFSIVGGGRTPMTDDEFRNKMHEALFDGGSIPEDRWPAFAQALHYRPLRFDGEALPSFQDLAGFLKVLDGKRGTRGNRIFYLAIPPTLYESSAQSLGLAGLAGEEQESGGWSRIVVEKPFGRNLQTAVQLNRSLHEHFQEHQIFRIDHYLAKETVQNILMFRFANAIFEPIWNRRYIDHVAILAAETLGVEHRAGYYEEAGVLRDMFQNHMMQLLSLTAIEPPSVFEADRVRDEKTKVFRSLRPFPVENLDRHLVLGQYEAGEIAGKRVVAYRDEPGVHPDSLTPTYASLRVFIDNWRWQGVPFFLTSGKRLARKVTEIAIQFKEVPHSLFRHMLGEPITANRLTLGVYPEERISLTFQAKNPGAVVRLRPVTMDFLYSQNYSGPVLDAYEKALLDCMRGDQTLFWRQDGVELCWSFLTPILDECETCGNREKMLLPYEAGSWGPKEAGRLMSPEGASWQTGSMA